MSRPDNSGPAPRRPSAAEEDPPVVIRDRRKVFADGGRPADASATDAATDEAGTADTAGATAPAGSAGPSGPADAPGDPAVNTADAPSEAETALAERTADLQRLQAEFANYRKRVDRDRILLGELAAGKVLETLLPVLDDIERAEQHGDLTGAFKAVADKLVAALEQFELKAFGETGDPFDPSLHEAVTHDESDEVDVPTASLVMRRGYRQGERLLRAAMVGVTAPSTPPVAGSEAADESQPDS